MSDADRVRAGVALLDEKVPGWDQRINLKVLDLQYCNECVLGQLFGHFAEGLNEVFQLSTSSRDDWLQLGAAIDHGFDAREGRGYEVLRRLWTYVIRQRRAVA